MFLTYKILGIIFDEGGKKQNRDRLQKVVEAIEQELNSDKYNRIPHYMKRFKFHQVK